MLLTISNQPLAIWHAALLVAVGGAGGAILRFLLSLVASSFSLKLLWGTLAANVIGCLAAGLLLGATRWASDPQHALRLLVMVGVLGGLTTFSAFSVETVQLLQQGRLAPAFANIAINLVLGLGAVWLGMRLTE